MKALVLHSGGLDSSVTVSHYVTQGYDVKLLYVLYGNYAWEGEMWSVEKFSVHYQIPFEIVKVESLIRQVAIKSPNLRRDSKDYDESDPTSFYVSCRNLLLCTIGAMICERDGYEVLAFGANHTESAYLDNTPEFVAHLNDTLQYSTKFKGVLRLEAPVVHMTKEEIVKKGHELNTPFQYSVSCYFPIVKRRKGKRYVRHCGVCPSCVLRKKAFIGAGVEDPTDYIVKKLPDAEE